MPPLGTTGRGRAAALREVGGLALALSAVAAAVTSLGCGDRLLYPFSPRDAGATGGGGGGVDAGSDGTGGARIDAMSEPPPTSCSDTFVLEGYASLGEGTTGGDTGVTMPATTQEEIQAYADMDARMVITIDRIITVTGQIDFNKPNKTLRGIGNAAGITGGGLRVKNTGNVIFQNLNISKAVGTDCITVETANHVWVDHCDLSGDRTMPIDTYDSLIDITHGSQNITVSWTRFHDHAREASFVGNGDGFGAEDQSITATFHHNYFTHTRSQNPSLRFGTVHAYNNYLKDIDMIGMSARLGGKLFAERNYFDNVPTSITTRPDSTVADGFLQEVSNTYSNGTPTPAPTTQTTTAVVVTYDFNITPVGMVPVIVLSCAGTGKI